MGVEVLALMEDGRLTDIEVWRGDGGEHSDPQLESFQLATYPEVAEADFHEGQRVRISSDYHYAQGATGTISSTYGYSQPGRLGLVRALEGEHGRVLFYWVELDEGQYDEEGDGPIVQAEIDGRYLEPIGNGASR
jgi:hypothetical protein